MTHRLGRIRVQFVGVPVGGRRDGGATSWSWNRFKSLPGQQVAETIAPNLHGI